MLNVKNLTLLSQKKWKKRREFWPRLQKKNRPLEFFLQPSVAFWLDFNKNVVLYRMKVISARKLYYQSSYGHFLPTTFEKVIFFGFFRQSDPPGRVKSVKMRNVCNEF